MSKLSNGNGAVKITCAMAVGNSTKCSIRTAGRPFMREAERVRGWAGMGGGKKFWGTFFCGLVLILGLPPALGAEPGSDEQKRRALELRLAISRLSETQVKERESLYQEILESCPATKEAEEALWALSNLYLDAFPEPKEQAAQEVLELFLDRYPDSAWGLHVRSRLILLYSGTDKRERAAELCRELLGQRAETLPTSCRPFVALAEAVVWDEEKDAEKAKEAYTQVARLYPGTPQAELAARRLAALSAGGTKGK